MLTDTKIKQAETRDKPYRLSDAKGLYLEVQPNGSKYWRVKYRFFGKEKRLAVGVYPKVTLKAARKACDAAKDLLERGIDPSQAKKAKKAALTESQKNNFESITREHANKSGFQTSTVKFPPRGLANSSLSELLPPFAAL